MTTSFSSTVMDHFRNPRHVGPLAVVSGEGWSGSVATSRFMRIQVRLNGSVVAEAGFGTYGCAPAIAAGSYVCEWACGRPASEAINLTATRLLNALGGLPEGRRYCADLAVDALQAALRDALTRKGELS